jgi:glycosyltransferase involved in cell wall biosynthesis
MTQRLLMIGPFSGPPGGATVLFRQLVTELQKRPNVELHVIDTSSEVSRMRFCRLFWIAFRTTILIWKSDLVSLHVSSMQAALYGFFVSFLCIMRSRNWVLRIFGDASIKHRTMRKATRVLFDWLLLRCPLLLVETRAAEAYFRHRCPHVEWYPNNRPLSPARSLSDNTAATRFVYIGHVKPSKGIRELLAAASMLGSEAKINVYGPLQGGIEAHEFAGCVDYSGELAPAAIPLALSQHDVLVLPTYYGGEGYPGVIFEAFAAGLPVIATRWQSIPEIVTAENGILVEPRSAVELLEAMQYFIYHPAEFHRRRSGALRSAQLFDSALWTTRFIQIVAEFNSPRKQTVVTPEPLELGTD